GRERDLVLRRLAAEQDRNTCLCHGGGGGPAGTKLPTTIVTVDPLAALVPPVGLCESTIPSRPGSPTSCRWTLTVKPALSSVDRAESSSWLVTSGTVDCFGPLETLSVIVAPGAAEPLGS